MGSPVSEQAQMGLATRPGGTVEIDVIHIGDYKTGSSWLQQEVFLQHPEIAYLDWPANNPGIAKLFYELLGARDLDFDAGDLASRFNLELDKIDCAGRKKLVSREALAGDFISGEHAQRIAQRLYQVFGPTKIVLVIREQFSMMASIYSQHVKIGGTLSLQDFVSDPIVASHLTSRLQYEKLIKVYMDMFGADNVSVKLFEELRMDKRQFMRDVLAHIGCEDIDCFPNEKSLTNPSLTTVGATCQRLLNRLVRTQTNPSASLVPLDKMVACLLTARQKQSLLSSAQVQFPWASVDRNPRPFLLYSVNIALNLKIAELCESIRFGKKIVVPPSVRDSFRDAFASSNQMLVSRYGLKLAQHGWVL